ncbi:HERV-H LTR-associating protein 2 isoform X2 [Microcaecilia unicolor]|uniref:HERV-H LTR-associating protein 2 isoform X2 n=1 Tax=Microcaecilia unicolor TaxID=1415580 RepID=A0A6P7YAE3_9AMPH|nr:HERV-H LTR-associating protein 2 isoform X2 [Microcaecilia unicolor]
MKDLLIHLILSSLIPTVFGHKVFGQLSEDVVLPCSFTPNSNDVIHWQRPGSAGQSDEILVHSYYHGKDQLEKQDVKYRNRTSLFHSELPKGNASLELRHLRLGDEGVYNCYAGTEYNIELKIISFSLSYRRGSTSRLECAAWGVRPLPSITWSDASGFINETNRTEVETDGLMSVISELNISDSNQVQCLIHNSVPNLKWQGNWAMTDPLHKVEGNEAILPCDFPYSLNFRNVRAAWSVAGKRLALFDNMTDILEDPRVSRCPVKNRQTDFPIILNNLTISDSGDYLCNISSHNYMQLRVTSLTVDETRDKMTNQIRHRWALLFSTLVVFIACVGIGVGIYCYRHRGRNENNQPSDPMEMAQLNS